VCRWWRNTYAYCDGHGHGNSYGDSDRNGNRHSHGDCYRYEHTNGYSGADGEADSFTETSWNTTPTTVVSLETVL
jgi:hypothetical protein